jgi:hypothetical protein
LSGAKKAAVAVKAAAAETTAGEPRTAAGRRNRQPDGRKGILVRARPEAWKALKLVALDEEKTLQEVMTEAINDVLQKYGRAPLA